MYTACYLASGECGESPETDIEEKEMKIGFEK